MKFPIFILIFLNYNNYLMNRGSYPYYISAPTSPEAKYKFPINLHFLPSIDRNSINS